jgi:hypothetical protein
LTTFCLQSVNQIRPTDKFRNDLGADASDLMSSYKVLNY